MPRCEAEGPEVSAMQWSDLVWRVMDVVRPHGGGHVAVNFGNCSSIKIFITCSPAFSKTFEGTGVPTTCKEETRGEARGWGRSTEQMKGEAEGVRQGQRG